MNTKLTLTALFAGCIAIANILAAKLAWIPVLDVAVPAGFLAFGVAYLCSDLLVEFEGRQYAHDVVNATLVTLVGAWGLIYTAILMPAAPFYEHASAFQTVLGSSWSIIAASTITVAISQHIDVRVFESIHQRTGDDHKWARNIGSTAFSQAVDTVVFITLGFAVFPALQGTSTLWGMALLSTIAGQYLVKLIVAGLDTPVFYLVSWWGERTPTAPTSIGGDRR